MATNIPDVEELRRVVKRALDRFPDFGWNYDPTATGGGWMIEVKRVRKGYGEFYDTDKVRQVQRDLLYEVRRSGFLATLGREDKESFILMARPQPPPEKDTESLEDKQKK